MKPPPDINRIADAVDRLAVGRVGRDEDIQTLRALGQHAIAVYERDERRGDYGFPDFEKVGHAAISHFLGLSTPEDWQLIEEAVDWTIELLARTDLPTIRRERAKRRRRAAASTTTTGENDVT